VRPVDPNRPKIGASWSPEEKQQLRNEFAAYKPFPDIAHAHGRTVGAITARLVKLGLTAAPATNRTGRGDQLAERSDFRSLPGVTPPPPSGGDDAKPYPF